MTTANHLDISSDGSVATIRLNRPERLNALNIDLVLDLAEAIRETLRRGHARSILLSAAGKSFCSGADLMGSQR